MQTSGVTTKTFQIKGYLIKKRIVLLSEYVKEVKQNFTRYYNKKHDQRICVIEFWAEQLYPIFHVPDYIIFP